MIPLISPASLHSLPRWVDEPTSYAILFKSVCNNLKLSKMKHKECKISIKYFILFFIVHLNIYVFRILSDL